MFQCKLTKNIFNIDDTFYSKTRIKNFKFICRLKNLVGLIQLQLQWAPGFD